MKHLFGSLITRRGIAANNRSESEGNITPLQKMTWDELVHSTVSAEAIRWSLRYFWQRSGYEVNRQWNAEIGQFSFAQPQFDPHKYVDDDVLGYMRAEAAKLEKHEEESSEENTENRSSKRIPKPKGIKIARQGPLTVNRALSTTPYYGDITFNAVSGEKNKTSLYGTEVHATRYQYSFAIVPQDLIEKNRISLVLDAIISLSQVGGNHARFLYDFSPESLILRWTDDFSPRILYCFKEEEGRISAPSLVDQIRSEDISPNELWIGGDISSSIEEQGINKFSGVKAAVESLKSKIKEDLGI